MYTYIDEGRQVNLRATAGFVPHIPTSDPHNPCTAMRVKPIGKGLTFTVVLSVWTVLSTLIIALRMFARYSIHKLGMDDYLMLGAWVSSCAPRKNET